MCDARGTERPTEDPRKDRKRLGQDPAKSFGEALVLGGRPRHSSLRSDCRGAGAGALSSARSPWAARPRPARRPGHAARAQRPGATAAAGPIANQATYIRQSIRHAFGSKGGTHQGHTRPEIGISSPHMPRQTCPSSGGSFSYRPLHPWCRRDAPVCRCLSLRGRRPSCRLLSAAFLSNVPTWRDREAEDEELLGG
jgi:hypothetical protein